jgi:hypothetical protein
VTDLGDNVYMLNETDPKADLTVAKKIVISFGPFEVRVHPLALLPDLMQLM